MSARLPGAAGARRCSGCGRSGTRIDACPACRAAGRWPPQGPVVSACSALSGTSGPAPRRSTSHWTLTFVPFGPTPMRVLDGRLATAQDGEKLAEIYNRLDWHEHVGLGADALVAVPRSGAFILQPVMR